MVEHPVEAGAVVVRLHSCPLSIMRGLCKGKHACLPNRGLRPRRIADESNCRDADRKRQHSNPYLRSNGEAGVAANMQPCGGCDMGSIPMLYPN
jgi:hypothetical protein